MQSLFGRVVFTCGGRTYTWEDILAAACLRGDWQVLETSIREGLACLQWAEDAEELASEEELDEAAAEFRYARNLLTSEETEAWLDGWGLTVDDWLDCVHRALLRERLSDRLEEILGEYEVGADEILECAFAQALCSGSLHRWAGDLARRAAAAQAMRAISAGGAESDGKDVSAAAVSGDAAAVMEALGLSSHLSGEMLDHVMGLERQYQRYCRSAVSPQTIEDQIALHHLDWVRFHCDSAVFAGEEIAREAILCVRADGADLREVAERARTEASEVTLCLGEVEPDWREPLLSAAAGDVIGPLRSAEHAAVLVVKDKVLPVASDPEIQQRAERAAVSAALETELRKHVEWQVSR